MAYADASPRLITEGFPGGLKVVLAGAVSKGDLIGYSSGWKRADANSSPVVRAVFIAAEDGAIGDTISVYRWARLSGYVDATPGNPAYLSDTAGAVGASASSTYSQIVGRFSSATECLLEPQEVPIGDVLVDGLLTNKRTITSLTSGATVTYTAAQLLAGFISDAVTAGCAATLPLGADLWAAIPGAVVGQSFFFVLKNAAAGAYTITVTANTGATIVGTATVAQNNTKLFLIFLSAANTYVAYSIGTMVH